MRWCIGGGKDLWDLAVYSLEAVVCVGEFFGSELISDVEAEERV